MAPVRSTYGRLTLRKSASLCWWLIAEGAELMKGLCAPVKGQWVPVGATNRRLLVGVSVFRTPSLARTPHSPVATEGQSLADTRLPYPTPSGLPWLMGSVSGSNRPSGGRSVGKRWPADFSPGFRQNKLHTP